MRFEVPQFIEIEDKIFGPLTWRQFLYLGGGVGMSIVMFLTLPFIIFAIFGLPLALLAGALAFYPINNRPFSFFLEAIFNFVLSQRLYIWRQKADVVYKSSKPKEIASGTYGPQAQTEKTKNIASLARRLELQALQKTE
jgi:heme/copper-type cytochrome/quinol oxidase subunit 1